MSILNLYFIILNVLFLIFSSLYLYDFINSISLLVIYRFPDKIVFNGVSNIQTQKNSIHMQTIK